jgi:opacity protein-like surface antigen
MSNENESVHQPKSSAWCDNTPVPAARSSRTTLRYDFFLDKGGIMKIAMALTGLVLVSVLALAADVDGTWEGVITITGSEVPVRWTFKADGDKLTGAVSQAGSPQMPIKDGKIDGQNISFVLPIEYQGMAMQVNYKGVVSQTEIKLTGEVQGQTFEYTVKKVK